MRRKFLYLGVMASGLALAATAGRGQFQKSMQVNTQTNPVNGGLYASPVNQSNLRYGAANPENNPLLPSQNRYLIVQSGLLPSQIRAGQMAAGPLAPGGATAILNPQSPLQQAVPAQTPPQGLMAANMSAPAGSIRYSGSTPGSANWGQVPSNVVSGQVPSNVVSGQVPSNVVSGQVPSNVVTGQPQQMIVSPLVGLPVVDSTPSPGDGK